MHSHESLVDKLVAKMAALESRLASEQKQSTSEDDVNRQKYMEMSRALELAQSELRDVEKELSEKTTEVSCEILSTFTCF